MEEIEEGRKKETGGYLKTAAEYFSEETKSLNNIENEGKLDLLNDASHANKGMVVNDITTFKDWFVGDEFVSKN